MIISMATQFLLIAHKKDPDALRAFSFQLRKRSGQLVAVNSASTTTTTTGTAAAAAVLVVGLGTARASRLSSDRNRCAFHAVEVRLVFLVYLFAILLVKVISAFDQDSALVRFGLTLVELMAGLGGCKGRRGGRLCNARLRLFSFNRRRSRLAQFGVLLADERLAAEFDAIAFNGQNLDHDLIALAQFVLHFLHAMLGDLGDVQQAVGAGEELDKRAEFSQANHLAQINLADLWNGGEVADDLQSLLQALSVARSNVHLAGIVHIDLGAGLLEIGR